MFTFCSAVHFAYDYNPPLRYSRTHRVSRFLDRWILALLSERRDDGQPDPYTARSIRLQFHVEYLKGKLNK